MHHSVVPSDGPSNNNLYKEKDAMRHLILLIALLALTGCTEVNETPPLSGTIEVTVCTTVPKALRFSAMPGLVLRVTLPTTSDAVHCHTSWRDATCRIPVKGPIKAGDRITVEVNPIWGDFKDFALWRYYEKDFTFDGTNLNGPPATVDKLQITVTSTFKPNP
jgi:hypothetical protein